MEFFKKQQLSIAYETTNNVAIINAYDMHDYK